MLLVDRYAKRIFNDRYGLRSKTADLIHKFAYENKIDPHLLLSLFYFEDYYRPTWLRLIEYSLYKMGILKNPTIGPFQIRLANLVRKRKKENIAESSLFYIHGLIKKSGVDKNQDKVNFIKLGKLYNSDRTYGEVIYKIWLMHKKMQKNHEKHK